MLRNPADRGHMKNLFAPATAADLKAPLARLQPDAKRQWGTMSPAQAMEHGSPGRLNPPQWSELLYKHLDYHLCQFDAE
jgi:hypothetical protein